MATKAVATSKLPEMPTGGSDQTPLPECNWSYAGETGPDNWGTICGKRYPTCAAGRQQSPINIKVLRMLQGPGKTTIGWDIPGDAWNKYVMGGKGDYLEGFNGHAFEVRRERENESDEPLTIEILFTVVAHTYTYTHVHTHTRTRAHTHTRFSGITCGRNVSFRRSDLQAAVFHDTHCI